MPLKPLVLVIVIISFCHGNFVEDYCWRDYNGITPEDAFRAGQDRNGDPIYIGQVLLDNKLIPGKIHLDIHEIHVEFVRVYVLNETIKILCARHPEKFQWVQVTLDEVHKIKDKHLFEGGYERGFKTYVGRALSHGEITVGKVICFDTGCYALTTIENGKWYDHQKFEILTYNPEAAENEEVTEEVNKPHQEALKDSLVLTSEEVFLNFTSSSTPGIILDEPTTPENFPTTMRKSDVIISKYNSEFDALIASEGIVLVGEKISVFIIFLITALFK